MSRVILACMLLVPGIVFAQTAANPGLNYTFGELRYVDLDGSGGDGIRLNGSYAMNANWILVGGLESVELNRNVDRTILEVGGGYVFNFNPDFDLITTLRVVNADLDTPGGDADDTGFAISAGARGMLTPQVELRGSVNHINLDNNDTFVEIAGDYHFTSQFSAGISVELAGDNDAFTIGARLYF